MNSKKTLGLFFEQNRAPSNSIKELTWWKVILSWRQTMITSPATERTAYTQSFFSEGRDIWQQALKIEKSLSFAITKNFNKKNIAYG